MSGRRSIRRLIGSGILAALLVAAQVAVVSHVDVEGHAVESACAICTSAAGLGAAAVATLALAVPHERAQPPVSRPPASVRHVPRYAQPARAPPAAS